MAATKVEIQSWLDYGKSEKKRWVIVVCDTRPDEDYPVYIDANEDFWERYAYYDYNNMQKIMEVYDMQMDLKEQLDAQRAYNPPPMPLKKASK